MTEPGRSQGSNGGRRAKRFLSPSQKYEIWIALLRGEVSTVEAAGSRGTSRARLTYARSRRRTDLLPPGVATAGPLRGEPARLHRYSIAGTR
jgi:transposase